MKKKLTAVILTCLAVIVVASTAVVLKTQVFGALKLTSANVSYASEHLSAYDLEYSKSQYEAHKNDKDYVGYVNKKADFTSDDPNDYCEVLVKVELENSSLLTAGMHSLSVKSDNDFVICGFLPEKSPIIAPRGVTDTDTYSFICLRNGRSDEEIMDSLRNFDYTYTYKNKIFGKVNFDIKLK